MTDVRINDRGEYTAANGTLWHLTGGAASDPDHEGAWLDCHGCNPPVVVALEDEPGKLGLNPLYQVRAEYAVAKDASAAAEERLKTAKSKLQQALSEAANGAYRSELRVPGFKPMTLVYTEPWTVDTKRLKAEQPAVYVEFAKRGSRWTLAENRSKS